ncbi:MAG: hydrogenase formation protein HypD [Planctomycetota bacterium]|jgi:hydrogenase expression/formation protein HypD
MDPRKQMSLLTAQLDRAAAELERPVALMEVCGTHTVNACRSGVHSLMPAGVNLVSGPGCPVCVTAQRYIDALIELGRRPDVTLLTYGDMVRVAGAGGSLELARSEGADVRVVTSTLEGIEMAKREPHRQMVFAAVGFETTAPASAAAVLQARRDGVANFTILPCHKLVVPAMRTLLADPEVRIDGFLCPGHVSVIIGAAAYRPIVEAFGKPCVVSGFEALQIMEGILHLVRQCNRGEARLENLYPQVVTDEGNQRAQALIDEVFVPGDSAWRALGVMPESGLDLRPEFAEFDAFERYGLTLGEDHDPPGCRCGEVISGKCEPVDCKLFGSICTPIYPVGPCMVSSEGTCQAWFKYRRNEMKLRSKSKKKIRREPAAVTEATR